MRTVSIREARNILADLERLLEAEGVVTITRRGVPVACLVPVGGGRKPIPSHRALRQRMPRLRRGSERLVREERDAS